MIGDKVSITFTCKICGGTVLERPDSPADDSRVKCQSCGADVGSWGELKGVGHEAAEKVVDKAVQDTLGKALKRIKNIPIK